MEIIEELEPAPRGFYTGAVGWTEPDGRSVFNIAIRTAVLDAAGLCYWAGGGIVADSRAADEYAETLLKTEAFMHALLGMERMGA
jgi:anthranilate/para-aminobenzoate synthase component I